MPSRTGRNLVFEPVFYPYPIPLGIKKIIKTFSHWFLHFLKKFDPQADYDLIDAILNLLFLSLPFGGLKMIVI